MTKIEKIRDGSCSNITEKPIESIQTYSRSQIEVGEKVIPDFKYIIILNKHNIVPAANVNFAHFNHIVCFYFLWFEKARSISNAGVSIIVVTSAPKRLFLAFNPADLMSPPPLSLTFWSSLSPSESPSPSYRILWHDILESILVLILILWVTIKITIMTKTMTLVT